MRGPIHWEVLVVGNRDGVEEEVPIDLTGSALAALFNYVDEAVLCCLDDGTITFASPGLRTLLGYDPESMVGHSVFEFVDPDFQERLANSLARWQHRSGNPRGAPALVKLADGSAEMVHYDTTIGVDLGRLGSMVLTLRLLSDVVGPSRQQHGLLNEDRLVKLASAFIDVPVEDFEKGLHNAMAVLASLEWVTRVSVWQVVGAGGDRMGLRAEWLASSSEPQVPLVDRMRFTDSRLVELVSRGEEVHLTEPWDVDGEFEVDARAALANGNASIMGVPMLSAGEVTGMILLESTVGQVAFGAAHTSTVRAAAAIIAGAFVRHEAELQLSEQARTDRVTGLGNRWAFDEALQEALHDLRSGLSRGIGLALIDLDRFKLVNDALGHSAGDTLLAGVAARLLGAANDQTLVARLGGDELLVLISDSASADDSHAALEDLLGSLELPFHVAGEILSVTASVGLVHAADGSSDAEDLLRRADVAMYRAKAAGGDVIDLDRAGRDSDLWSQLQLEVELRRAIQDDDLQVHYQGEWDLVTGELLGAEALVRWVHPVEGMMNAADFVPLAEERGLINQLGRRVLNRACHDMAALAANSTKPFILRVNLAAAQLRQADLADQIADVLEDGGLEPEALCLELTESTLLADPLGSEPVFASLRELGVGLAIDDFGTGYSSLGQLQYMPITALKIDRSFVAGLPDSAVDRAIVRTTVQLADALDVTVTAEGIETEAQRDALVELGCRRGQGYLLSHPEPLEEFRARLAGA